MTISEGATYGSRRQEQLVESGDGLTMNSFRTVPWAIVAQEKAPQFLFRADHEARAHHATLDKHSNHVFSTTLCMHEHSMVSRTTLQYRTCPCLIFLITKLSLTFDIHLPTLVSADGAGFAVYRRL